LCDLGEFDRGGRLFVCRALKFHGFIWIRVGHKRIDRVGTDSLRELQCDGFG
jgi:hypothetical protein